MPILTFFMLLFTLSSIGLPGLNGFAGEFLILIGMFQRGWQAGAPVLLSLQFKVISVLAVLGVVLGAWYMLLMVQRVFFGPLKHAGHHDQRVRDLSTHEIFALLPLVVFMFWIGLAPQFFLDRMAPALDRVSASVTRQYETRYALQEARDNDARLADQAVTPPGGLAHDR
jgi:NADH-quinone oxidoreductase subunit M